jgi:molybdate transport system substrate-binding protein
VRWLRVLLAVAVVLHAAACGPGGVAQSAAATQSSAADRLSGDLTVFAAASLTDAFEALGSAFEADHPGVSVTFNFAGSQQLATQIVEGAPADVFASASGSQVDVVADADLLAGEPVEFATNRLEIAVEPGNPKAVAGLSDLARGDVTVVLAAEEVPAGQYAREALDAAGVRVTPVSLETDVRAVLTKVALGEADAGIVYASDIIAAGDDVTGVEIADEENVTATYPAAAIAGSPNPGAAQAFLAHLTSHAGRATLEEFGFAAP